MPYNLNNLSKIANALKGAGLTGNALALALAQAAHESANFNDPKIITHNNASGITWSNRASQKNATKGNPLPEAPKYNYARFATLTDWAKDYLRIVKKSLLSSNTPGEFATKLKEQKYYTAPLALYAKALQNQLKAVQNQISKIKPTTIPIVPLLVFAAIGLFFLTK
jgi:hypothetical protein